MSVSRSAALGFLLGLALPLTSVAQAPVEADRHSCSELEKLIADAGRLQLRARNRNPGGNEDHGLHTFSAPGTRCPFFGEMLRRWRIYAANNEICENVYMCQPESVGPDR